MSEMLNVEAPVEEVRAVLADTLSAEELSLLRFDQREKAPDPFDVGERGEVITLITVVIWTAQAVASGVVGGAAWDLTKKAHAALARRFGEHNVAVEDQEDGD